MFPDVPTTGRHHVQQRRLAFATVTVSVGVMLLQAARPTMAASL